MNKSASKPKAASARAGRRAGSSTSRADILRAARSAFAEHGYKATTIRQVAADAKVDPALVHYFFGSKEQLFGAAMELPYSPADIFRPILADGLDGAGVRIVRRFLEVWENPAAQPAMIALVRNSLGDPGASQPLREFLEAEVRPTIASAVGTPDADLRATLIASSLIGMVIERFLLPLEPLASADPETLVAWVGPTVQRYLTGADPTA